MSDVIYSILETLGIAGVALGVSYFCADGAMASLMHETSQDSIKRYKETGDRDILERQKEALSKADPHNIGFLTRSTKKGILKEIEQLMK